MQSETPSGGWRALPPPLAIGICVSLISSVTAALDRGSISALIATGLSLATYVLQTYGLLVLARRHAGTTRIGLRLLAASMTVTIALVFGWQLVLMRQMAAHHIVQTLQLVWFGIALLNATAVGMVLTGTSAIGVVAAPVLLIVAQMIPWVVSQVAHRSSGRDAVTMVTIASAIGSLVRVGTIAYALIRVAGVSEPPAPTQVARGLRHAGLALTWCVVALLAVTLFFGMVSLALVIASTWFASIAVTGLGVSLLRASRTAGGEPAPYLLSIAAALVLVCGGGLLNLALTLVQGMDWWGSLPELSSIVSCVVLAELGGVVVAAAIARYASGAGFDALRVRATVVGVAVLALLIFVWIGRMATAPAALIISAVMIAGAAMLLAWICRMAAQSLERTSDQLPVARVV